MNLTITIGYIMRYMFFITILLACFTQIKLYADTPTGFFVSVGAGPTIANSKLKLHTDTTINIDTGVITDTLPGIICNSLGAGQECLDYIGGQIPEIPPISYSNDDEFTSKPGVVMPEFAFGYEWSSWGIVSSFDYSNMEFINKNKRVPFGGVRMIKQDINNILVGAYYKFNIWKNFTPFIGAGYGLSLYELNVLVQGSNTDTRQTVGNNMLYINTGVQYNINSSFGIMLEYKLTHKLSDPTHTEYMEPIPSLVNVTVDAKIKEPYSHQILFKGKYYIPLANS